MSRGDFRLALVTPTMTSGEVGGAEVLIRELAAALDACGARSERIEVPVDESDFDAILRSYARCYDLELDAYDLVISTKAPTYMVRHRNHVSLLVHTIRVFYDRFEDELAPLGSERAEQRRRIHALDLAAFRDGRIQARFAIGEPVVERLVAADPAWRELPFRILDLPPRMRSAGTRPAGRHFLLPGRLHRWKRVDLAIEAVRRLEGDARLVVVGAGEDEGRFRQAAGNDPRIEFRGAVPDAELRDLYAQALAVPFVPIGEDFGFVAVEAFAHGVPVVTCADSGQPRRLVERSGGGLVVEPRPAELARALDSLRRQDGLARVLGERGRKYASSLSWEDVARALLEAGGFEARRPACPSRMTLAVLDTQPIEPPVGGGRLRLRGLYGTLDAETRALYVGSYDWRGPGRRRVEHGPRLEEWTVPHSDAHFAAAEALERLCGGRTVIDVTQPLLAPLSAELLEEARTAMEQADVVVFSHPWLYPPLAEDVRRLARPVVYDAQNFEWGLRRELLGDTPLGRALAEAVGFFEGALCRRADLVLACCEEDGRAFELAYGIERDRVAVVPNGVDTEAIAPGGPGEREAARRALGLAESDSVALFLGSGYEPNREAVRWIARELAPALPAWRFLLVGGACDALPRRAPRNLVAAGTVTDAERLAALRSADVALNPMAAGSGTNIKMFDFMAAGLPTLATPIGGRGIDPGSPPAFRVVERDGFSAELARLGDEPATRAALGRAARERACADHDWRKLSGRVAELCRGLLGARRAPAFLRRPPAISVVVPSYDRPGRLRALLSRLAEQRFRDFEVLVVEQGPGATDLGDSRGLRLRHLRTAIRGAVRARNTGLALARGAWVAFVDDDCLPEPEWLEAIAAAATADANAVGVEGLIVPDRPDAHPKRSRLVTNLGFEGIGFMTANLAVRLADARAVGGFDEIFDHPHFREDTDFGWRLSERGPIPFVREARVVHPVLPRSHPRESAEARGLYFEKDPVLFEKHPRRYPDLFVAEGNYAKIPGFWDAFRRGLEKYEARIDAAALVTDPRVEREAIPRWLHERV